MRVFRKTPPTPPKTKPEVQSLDCRYGKIGISAVAAAVRYQSEPKNMAYAPAAPRGDRWQFKAA